MRHEQEDWLGATPLSGGVCRFCVWAPHHRQVEVYLIGENRVAALACDTHGYHRATLEGVSPGSCYLYRLSDGVDRPDPASRFQPEGVHKASEVVDLAFNWADAGWSGVPLSSYVIYELHVGTFTSQGTFDAVINHLDRLYDLGITAIEIMPVASFPGTRNWGYDGVYPFAVQASYGGPKALQRLVDACHARGLAVVLDVVYNHLGPEGNYLEAFGPYFTDVYRTPWGKAINFDGPYSDDVRRFFIENALQWVRHFHIDALRLDAVHAILDRSARPFLEQLADEVRALGDRLGRCVALMAESNLNDPRLIRHSANGGMGLDAMWCDDLHHAVHTLLTGEKAGYYADFGRVEHLARAWEEGMTYTGDYSVYYKRHHGRRIEVLKPQQIVVCVQNHDQVGNRLDGDRLSTLVDFEAQKLAAGVVLLSPHVPLLFMGQEYGETTPFQYFISHADPELIDAVRQGRREEFRSFHWKGEIPNPQSVETFRRCLLNHDLRRQDYHAILHELYRELLTLRHQIPVVDIDDATAFEAHKFLLVCRGDRAWMGFHFAKEPSTVMLSVPAGAWVKSFDSAKAKWQGPGTRLAEVVKSKQQFSMTFAPCSFCVYRRVDP